ncbi:MAG TPA: hypothetical protein VFA17_08540 [Thermoplasmata archaeon]|nr:hypothetical protein [Thermoplasmata archaeon]
MALEQSWSPIAWMRSWAPFWLAIAALNILAYLLLFGFEAPVVISLWLVAVVGLSVARAFFRRTARSRRELDDELSKALAGWRGSLNLAQRLHDLAQGLQDRIDVLEELLLVSARLGHPTLEPTPLREMEAPQSVSDLREISLNYTGNLAAANALKAAEVGK